MNKIENFDKQVEFLQQLRRNQLSTPNLFTIGMGELIRQARENIGLSQADLAKALNRRQGTISDIENGKSDISITTLVQFAIELKKPISYFFPESLLRDSLVDVKTSFQHKMLEIASNMEPFGDQKLVLEILDVLEKHFFEEQDRLEHPEDYYPDDEE